MAESVLAHPGRRNLAILAVIAAIAIALAALALWWRQHELAPHYTPEYLFPKLAQDRGRIADIRIVSKKGTFDIAFHPDTGWVIPQKSNYPAAFDKMRETVIGLESMQTIEPKTARPEWLPLIDLDAPPKGNGIEVSLLDEKGHAIAAVITGKSVDIGDQSGAEGLFVRKPDSNQAWLVRSIFNPDADPASWLDKHVMDVDAARIQEVDVDPAGSASFSARREKPGDADFSLTGVPKGREVAFPGAADGVANAITGFTFDDVKPVRDFDFSDSSKTARVVTRTFDGLRVSVDVLQKGQDYWATVAAEALPGRKKASKEAREIDAHTSGWAYKLPAYKGQVFMTTLESLLKPATGASAPKK